LSVLKDLGTLQKKILYFLAENPRHHKQSIQREIGKQQPIKKVYYGSVLNAVKKLEETGYLESEKVTSEKNREIKLFSCTDKGAFYALTMNPKADFMKILEHHKDKYPIIKFLREEYDKWGHKNFLRFLEYEMKFLPMVERDGLEEAFPYIITDMFQEFKELSLDESIALIKEMVDKSPKAKKTFKRLKKLTDKLFSEVKC
jgi:DNA-binding PadR family transcriptional regulator